MADLSFKLETGEKIVYEIASSETHTRHKVVYIIDALGKKVECPVFIRTEGTEKPTQEQLAQGIDQLPFSFREE